MRKVTKRILILVAVFGFGATCSAHAQPVGECELGQAYADLEVNNIRARLFNTGGLFWKGGDPVYEVPKDSGIHSMFAAGLWIGGMIGEELHFAGADYGDWEFWPGPLDPAGNPPDDCSEYDRFWSVTLEDVLRYNTTGAATADLLNWPHDLDAPVLDGDGIAGNYNLAGGDRPAILGDQTVWWVMNDRGNAHFWGGTQPLGIEVQVTAFSFSEAYALDLVEGGPFLEETAEALDHTTLYRYQLIYLNDEPMEDVYVGFWADPDLGNFNDDYVGSMPHRSAGYVYNGDNDDRVYSDEGEVTSSGYEDRPPAMGVTFLEGPAERDMAKFIDPRNPPCPICHPNDADDAYKHLQGLWRNGDPLTYGGDGMDQDNPPTDYMYPSPPPTFWSEENPDGQGHQNTPSDRRFLMSHGPFTLEPGDTTDVHIAIVWSQAEQGRIASVRKLDRDLALVRALTFSPDPLLLSGTLENLPVLPNEPEGETAPASYALAAVGFPNPFTASTTIRYHLPEAVPVRLAVYDVLGREIAVLVDEAQEVGEKAITWTPNSQLSSGSYIYRLEAGTLRARGRMLLIH